MALSLGAKFQVLERYGARAVFVAVPRRGFACTEAKRAVTTLHNLGRRISPPTHSMFGPKILHMLLHLGAQYEAVERNGACAVFVAILRQGVVAGQSWAKLKRMRIRRLHHFASLGSPHSISYTLKTSPRGYTYQKFAWGRFSDVGAIWGDVGR